MGRRYICREGSGGIGTSTGNLYYTGLTFNFGAGTRNNKTKWLSVPSGSATTLTGHRIPVTDLHILAISVQTQNLCDATFHIRKNGSTTDIETIVLSSQSGKSRSIDVAVDLDDWLTCWMEVHSGNVDHPNVTLVLSRVQ